MKTFRLSYKNLGYLMVLLAASIWSTLGIFGKIAFQEGLKPLELMFYRSALATIILFLFIQFFKKDKIHIDKKDIFFFLLYGTLSVGIFYLLYFSSILHLKVGVASALLYTSPLFVVILSRFLFKELLTLPKLLALFFTLLGVTLLSEFFPIRNLNLLSTKGVLYGLGSGFTYALYTIFGKKALSKYSPITLMFYTLFFGSVTLGIFLLLRGEILHNSFTAKAIISIIMLSILTTIIAYYFYVEGLKRIEASKASIISTVEPVIAWLLAYIVLKESLNYYEGLGFFLILFGALLVIIK